MDLVASAPSDYVGADHVIQSKSPRVIALARQLRAHADTDVAYARSAYEWVRDQVAHSLDANDPRVTVTATDVLEQRVGLCFAKSHLYAALLRAEGIPAGLCYQRLGSETEGHVVHGLVAAHLNGAWHRLDVRGNNARIDAQFSVDHERLAWTADPARGERDYPRVYPTPAPEVLAALAGATDAVALCVEGLPTTLPD